jgi:hypothetical protein
LVPSLDRAILSANGGCEVNSKHRAAVGLIALSIVLASTTRSWASEVIFDSRTPPPSFGGFSSPNNGVTTQIAVATDVRIGAISVLNESFTANRFRFCILSEPAHEFLYMSPPQSFAADPTGAVSWKRSDPLDVLLTGGQSYLVGYLRESAVNEYFDTTAESMGGITSSLAAHTLSGFAQPSYSHRFLDGGDMSVRLHAVPEPSVTPLLIVASALSLRRPRAPRMRAASRSSFCSRLAVAG